MTLMDLLKALSWNKSMNITLQNMDGDNLITFNAGGYASVESDLGERGVKRVSIVSASAVTIVIEDAPESTPEPDPDPVDPTDP